MFRNCFIFSILVLLYSCEEEKKIPLSVGSQVFMVEIADDSQEHQKGLMHRESLNRGEGMLFIFSESQPRSFWMKNTQIPLSIAYINEEGIIIDILPMEPMDLSAVRSSAPARYALEVNRGEFAYYRIQVGDRVKIPAEYQ